MQKGASGAPFFEVLCNAKAAMPAWMLKALRRYEEDVLAHG